MGEQNKTQKENEKKCSTVSIRMVTYSMDACKDLYVSKFHHDSLDTRFSYTEYNIKGQKRTKK